MIKVKRLTAPNVMESHQIRKRQADMEKFFSTNVQSRRQHSFRFDMTSVKNVRPYLEAQFKNKCAYCESSVVFPIADVDNFRPKGGSKDFDKFYEDHYYWLAYEWKNLYLSCQKCNRFKQSWFPVQGNRSKPGAPYEEVIKEQSLLIDPCNDNPEEHLIFEISGKANWISQKGETTITILKLNRDELVFRRRKEMLGMRVRLKQISSGAGANTIKLLKVVYAVMADNSEVEFAGALRALIFSVVQKDQHLYKLIFKYIPTPFDSAFIGQLEQIFEKSGSQYTTPGPIRKSVLEKVRKSSRTINISTKGLKTLSKKEERAIEKIFLRRIEITNFKAIKRLTLDFPEIPESDIEPDKLLRIQEPWLMLLGENGVGKSTLLQAITLALMGNSYLQTVGIKASQIINNGKAVKNGFVKVYHHGSDVPYSIHFNSTRIDSSHEAPPTYLLAYGSTRLAMSKTLNTEEITGTVKAMNLFFPETALCNATQWIIDLHKKGQRSKPQKQLFDWVGRALKDLLLLEKNEKLVVEKGLAKIRYTKSRADSLEQLSDGYRSVITMAIDIMQTLIKDKTTMEHAQGIVLIDEIGTHLHPRWKMQVVTRLRKVFPKLQFVATTHDPLCLRGLNKGEIVVCTKTHEKKVNVLTDLPDPAGMNAEQLLGSQFFGLNSTYDWEEEEKFNEYFYLLSKKKLNTKEEKKKNELESFVATKQQIGSSLFEQTMHAIVNEKIAESKFVKPKSAISLKKETLDKIKAIWNEQPM